MTLATMFVTLIAYVFICWVFNYKPTQLGYTFILVVNMIFNFNCEILKKK